MSRKSWAETRAKQWSYSMWLASPEANSLNNAFSRAIRETIAECARLTGVVPVALEPEAGRVERTRAACAAAILALLEPGDEGEGG